MVEEENIVFKLKVDKVSIFVLFLINYIKIFY